MSLINDALKKAQRLRTEQAHVPTHTTPPIPGVPGPARVAKRTQAMPAQTLVLLVGAGAVLIVLSAVATGYFLTRTPDAPPAHAQTKAAPPAPNLTTPTPVIVAPVVAVPKSEPPPASSPSSTPTPVVPSATTPAPSASTTVTTPTAELPAKPVVSAPAPEIAAPAAEIAVPPAPKPAAPRPNPEIQAYVDGLRVAGVRFSGNDSKVLMNDRVYRVNDVVNYSLNLRLQQVSAGSLTFVDVNGLTYVKNF